MFEKLKNIPFDTTQAVETMNKAKAKFDTMTLASLKKMGLATRAEVRELEKKVEDLASELRAQIAKLSRKSN